ncbi:MarR family transcriptional regulator [Frankia sp. CcI49]|uniref:MarR family winged helix-turn-helix transcriptional regulator n=1 Tax=Frankia sp. CcI49 TaxID=1745382 RepID=UPI001F529FC5|nr:MarR family transcriptional regulator [Frankia sp. CcI49]
MRGEIGSHEIEIAADVRRGVARLTRRLRAERAAGALSVNKIMVLGHLYREGPSTPGEVAAAEGQQPQSLTRVFADLERDGLLTRRRSEQDRRESVLEITPAGREEMERDMAERDAWLAATVAGLTEAEADLLGVAGRLLSRIASAPSPSAAGRDAALTPGTAAQPS